MWSAQIRRRKQALRLVKTAGAEVQKEFGKSQMRQLLELGVLGLRGYSTSDYYMLDLYKDYTQAWTFMNRGQFDMVRRKWNPPVQGIFEFNKWIFGNYCAAVGIPTPTCYGLFHPRTGITAKGSRLRDQNDLSALMASIDRPMAFKPIAGSHGDNVLVIDLFDAASKTVKRANKQEMRLEDLYQILIQQKSPWILQEKVRQHQTLLELHESSLNTSRIITLQGADGEIQIPGAVLRIGVGDAEIDNTTGGGIAAQINLASGRCGLAISETTIRKIPLHPDTGSQIEGLVVPFWEEMKQTAIKAHRLLPFARSLGWDVAFSEQGPVVLEVNGTWHYNHIQMTGKSLWDTAFGKPPTGPRT